MRPARERWRTDASPTTSFVTVLRPAVKANGTGFSIVRVNLRTALGAPVAGKQVMLVGTGTTTRITPASGLTNVKGIVSFEVSDSVIQTVIYRATDLTDGILLVAPATVRYRKP